MPSGLSNPHGIEALLLFRMSKIVSIGGGLVTRLCEGQFGITRREWSVIGVLATEAEMVWPELAHRSELESARLSRAVTSLVEKGLALKTHGAGREIKVSLSERGRALHQELFPLARQINLDLLHGLDDETLVDLDNTLSTLHRRAEALARQLTLPKAERRLGRRS